MKSKAEILIHPVRMKITQVLMRNKENGLTPLEMVKLIKDVPQATIYRHIQVLLDADIIHVLREQKVRSVFEKYYTINVEAVRLDSEDWRKLSKKEKVNFLSYYQLSLMTQYQNYLSDLEQEKSNEDKATFSLLELNIDDQLFENFQEDLNNLMLKYYKKNTDNPNVPSRTIAVTIIPKS